MSRVVLSIGSNVGDRRARLQAVVDAAGDRVLAVSPVFETDAWGGVEQGPFLNAILVAEDAGLDGRGWLAWAQQVERDNQRVRAQKWGPRTLDVDLVCCFDDDSEIFSGTAELTLPHPFAHQRAFVLVPWLALDPAAEMTVAGRRRPVTDLLAELGPAEHQVVRPTDFVLTGPVR